MLSPTPWRRHPAGPALLVLAGLAGCATGAADPQPALVGRLEPVYCYQRLVDVTCHTVPDPGRERQLTGVYLRDADDPAWADWWLRRDTGRR